MVWVFFVAVAVLVIAGFLALLTGRVPFETMSPPTHTTPPVDLPESARSDDVVALRFDTALRGYRMDQVDEALGVLSARIAALEAELDEHRAR